MFLSRRSRCLSPRLTQLRYEVAVRVASNGSGHNMTVRHGVYTWKSALMLCEPIPFVSSHLSPIWEMPEQALPSAVLIQGWRVSILALGSESRYYYYLVLGMFPVDFCGLQASEQANGTVTTPLRKKRPHFSGGTVVVLHDSHPQHSRLSSF